MFAKAMSHELACGLLKACLYRADCANSLNAMGLLLRSWPSALASPAASAALAHK